MAPLIVFNAINAGLALVEAMLPVLQKLQLSGEISVEQQKAVRAKYLSLRARADGQFSGPEWMPSSKPPDTPA